MEIIRLQSVTEAQVGEILDLMRELDPAIEVMPAMIRQAVGEPGTRFFALMDGAHIVGCASLCVTSSPTGCKAHIEDVVVRSSYRGRHLGRRLLEHLIAYARTDLPTYARTDLPSYARTELPAATICLTSRPHRIAANALYQSLGFRRKETNVYVLE